MKIQISYFWNQGILNDNLDNSVSFTTSYRIAQTLQMDIHGYASILINLKGKIYLNGILTMSGDTILSSVSKQYST